MVDRARQAKLPLPEAGLKCPRCESTNTKFCYFNNYSLAQPRHFCKTCRRYWTRGGALRNVPVGGGCRRNKRNKSSSSKSSANNSNERLQNMGTSSSTTSASPSSTEMAAGHFSQPSTQLPLMATLQNLHHHYEGGASIGVFQQQQMLGSNGNGLTDHMGFHLGNGSSNLTAGGGSEQWRLASLGGLMEPPPPPPNLYPFHQSEGIVASSSMINENHQLGSVVTSSSGVATQPSSSSVKMEENKGLNLAKQFLGTSENNQYWSGNTWPGFSGLNSTTSSSHLL